MEIKGATSWPQGSRAESTASTRRSTESDVTIWLSEDAIAAWIPPKNGLRGGQRRYSNLAIRTALTLPSAETVLRWYPCGNRILAQPDRDVPAAPEATLVLPPVPDSVLRLVLAVDSARLPCGHDVAPLISMMDRNPPPMLACPLTPIHAPMPLGTGTCIDSASFLMLAPWPIGDKRTCRSDLCNNAVLAKCKMQSRMPTTRSKAH